MKFSRDWCMPSADTFSMKPVKILQKRILFNILRGDWIILDPFARRKHGFATIYNDLNPACEGMDFNLDALEFLQLQPSNSARVIQFDPPYSNRQLKECYDDIGLSLTQHQTRHYWKEIKDEITRVLMKDGLCISFGWSTVGIGKTRGFEIREIKLICHGGIHHDTIITVEQKVKA